MGASKSEDWTPQLVGVQHHPSVKCKHPELDEPRFKLASFGLGVHLSGLAFLSERDSWSNRRDEGIMEGLETVGLEMAGCGRFQENELFEKDGLLICRIIFDMLV